VATVTGPVADGMVDATAVIEAADRTRNTDATPPNRAAVAGPGPTR
jgi:hypothetical protein